MNLFIITGRVAKDLEFRQTQSGTSVAQFSFAVNRSFKKEGEPDADFFQINFFGKMAEALQKCSVGKGTKLMLECEVRQNNYTDKNGNKVYGFQFIGKSFEFCESKSSQQKQAPQDYAPAGRGYGTPTQQPSYQQQGFVPQDWEQMNEDEMETLPF